jgi:excisionase family DNA binding protein
MEAKSIGQVFTFRSKYNDQATPILVSKRNAAQLLDVCVRTIEQLISRGDLRPKRIGRRVLLLREDLETFAHTEEGHRS